MPANNVPRSSSRFKTTMLRWLYNVRSAHLEQFLMEPATNVKALCSEVSL